MSGRIIPARAGFTISDASTSGTSSDHPRSRGVYATAARKEMAGSGSSPLARGLLLASPHMPSGVGIIPARAGFTYRLSRHC